MKFLRDMTASELAQARKDKLPLHCQTMSRRSRVYEDGVVFGDVEELSRENLEARILEMRQQGWKLIGTYFVRTYK